MKNLTHLAVALLLFCSCQKVDLLVTPGKVVSGKEISPASSAQNLGHVFSGTNISWKLHPLDAGNTPLFTFSPGQSSGYCLLMVDNGLLDGATPVNAFRFVAVNIESGSSKIVTVKGADGNPAGYSLGRITYSIFGTDKKFYVATQGTPDGGGRLVQYDPATQTARDLGKPFKRGTSGLDIAVLNIGVDGALYGGSSGGEGEVMTFRYDYKSFYVDATPLDTTSRYVTSVSGDSRFTYAVCGKNNWFLYAIDRQTGERRTLKSNMGSSVSIDIASHTDAPYAHSVATHYRLSGFTAMALPEYERPLTNRMVWVPYSDTDPTVPQVFWSDADKKVVYKKSNGQTGAIAVAGLQEDIYPTTGPMMYFNDKLYLVCYKQGLLGTYAPGEGFKKVGSTSMGIQTMLLAPANSPDAGKIFLAGYPKGGLLQYTPVQDWSVNISGFNNANGGYATTSSNPRQSALFQDADASGTHGSMSLLAIKYTKNGYIAGAGNNDRITLSSGRELSMGSYKNGAVRNLYLPEFANYNFQSMCLSKDSNYILVSGVPKNGTVEKLYKYDPAANQVVAAWDLPLWDDLNSTLCVLTNDLLVGYCGDALFIFDLTKGQIIYKEVLHKKICSIIMGPDNTLYVNYMNSTVFNYKIAKYNFNVTDRSNITTTSSPITELNDEDMNERSKPTGMLVVSNKATGSSDLYISGLFSLYKIRL
ncbi:MAG: hypothetical protein M3040_18145 [Bacteroidota bacterium]|nr:hypothetical protein [Bacteroidota bacterium]